MASGSESEIYAMLEVLIGGADELLKVERSRDEGVRPFGFGCLTKGVSIDYVLNIVNCRREEMGMVLD